MCDRVKARAWRAAEAEVWQKASHSALQVVREFRELFQGLGSDAQTVVATAPDTDHAYDDPSRLQDFVHELIKTAGSLM